MLVLLFIAAAFARTVSQNGIDLIKKWEGCELTAYWDSYGGVWTIGYGTTEYDEDIIGQEIYEGLTISQETAEYWLQISVDAYYSPNVNKFMDIYNFNQNQFDALTSFAYNIGSIDELVNYGYASIAEISENILLYCYAGGVWLQGLYNRRLDEKTLFDTPADGGDSPAPDNNNNGGTETVPSDSVVQVIVDAVNVRASASTSSEIVATYGNGDTFYYDSIVRNSECSWISYIGGSGNRRYVCGKSSSGYCYVSPCP